MKLWSDYEGRTIAEAYPLKKLVRPEGRSAFFLTTNGTGTPALVRLIEAHFDEPEILNRWKTVSEIGQENLMVIRKFGQTELDGTPLVYAVMEPTEISLDELLGNRTLTAEETKDLAHSLIGALQALHARGLVHGQIEPVNILAAGEMVKLRSDCVREIIDYPDSDGPTLEEMKAQDAQALAVVLLQALTGRTTLQGSATLLPPPFDGIIRNGLSGRWGLAEMASALGPAKPKQVPVVETKPAVAAPVAAAATTGAKAADGEKKIEGTVPAGVTAKSAVTGSAASTASPRAEAAPVAAKTEPQVPLQENLFAPKAGSSTSAKDVAAALGAGATATPATAPDVRHRFVKPVEDVEKDRSKMWIAVAAALLVLMVLGWRLMRSEPAKANGTAKPVSTLGDAPAANAPTANTAASKPSATHSTGGKAPAAAPARSNAAVVTGGAGPKTQWRVVAFTYNHQEQAQQKADSIKSQHPGLNAEVFSATGRAPYLVTVGGPMTRDQAEAFKRKARSEGLPRDTYAQNYSH
ncbi:MAG: hypothetical protein PW789_09445 [Edaphobacter sp.]|uniref:hypothetical protein n=1 Tax=Edaphobacter sp. TaxID=1934404 RepID=UPI002397C10F|nr:hypothetical protein [Edaphobacter sp.]MDE1176818.1 hypothetical protein [Edaphobacter sp.]